MHALIGQAAEPWQLYEEGIYDGNCGADVDHAIQVIERGGRVTHSLTHSLTLSYTHTGHVAAHFLISNLYIIQLVGYGQGKKGIFGHKEADYW